MYLLKYFFDMIVLNNMNITLFSGTVLLNFSHVLFTMALGGILYQHVVELPRWKTTEIHPPNFNGFFKLLMPTSFFGLLLAMFLLWEGTSITHWYLLAVMIGMLLTTIFTNYYFVPIHTQLFQQQITQTDREILTNKWLAANRYRMVLMLITIMFFII